MEITKKKNVHRLQLRQLLLLFFVLFVSYIKFRLFSISQKKFTITFFSHVDKILLLMREKRKINGKVNSVTSCARVDCDCDSSSDEFNYTQIK